MRLSWSAEEVDQKLHGIMKDIYKKIDDAANRYGMKDNFVAGANIAGFEKVVEAMKAQGLSLIHILSLFFQALCIPFCSPPCIFPYIKVPYIRNKRLVRNSASASAHVSYSDYTLDRYSPVLVSIFNLSPWFTNSGT